MDMENLLITSAIESLLQYSIENPTLSSELYDEHAKFQVAAIEKPLIRSINSVESAQIWVLYWCIHAIYLTCNEKLLNENLINRIFIKLDNLKTKGLFSSGDWQTGNIGGTYAGLAISCYLNYNKNFNRERVYDELMDLKNFDGSFRISKNGESDLRVLYCAVSIAYLLDIMTDEFLFKVDEFVQACQNIDGGFAGVPNGESHLGYTYCALATLVLIDQNLHKKKALSIWLLSRITDYGYNGRPDKLVDSCYTFWLNGSLLILSYFVKTLIDIPNNGIKEYVLKVCQPGYASISLMTNQISGNSRKGGISDQPGKNPDWYHTCYALSGISLLNFWNEFGMQDHEYNIRKLKHTCPVTNIVKSYRQRFKKSLKSDHMPKKTTDGLNKFDEWIESIQNIDRS